MDLCNPGVSSTTIKITEDVVKDTLTKWLQHFHCVVLWEKKNKYNYPIFKPFIKGKTTRKPDLIVLRNGKAYAIEVKDADKPSGIVLGSINQILKYADDDLIYFYDNKKIVIDGYIIATQYSLNGHLLNPEYDDSIHPTKEYKQSAVQHGVIPKNEYRCTKLITRILWDNAKERGFEGFLGVLLSNKLNDESSCAPMVFFKYGKNQNWDVWL